MSWRSRRRAGTAPPQPVTRVLTAVSGRDGGALATRPLGAGTDPRAQRDLAADAAMRVLNLVLQMRSTLDTAMRDQGDPDTLDTLYGLDALGCQARRVAENLYVLSGRPLLDPDRQVTSVADVLAAALGRIAGWARVTIGPTAEIAVAEDVSGDLIRIMTELLDNAVRYSPQDATVTASGHLLYDGGLLLRVEDLGIGLRADDLARHNTLLRSPHAAGPATPGARGGLQQGLQVVCRAAGVHGIRVSLASRSPQGTTAMVYVPPGLLTEIPAADAGEPALPGGHDGAVLAGPDAGEPRRPGVVRPVPVRVPQRVRDLYPLRPVAGRAARPDAASDGGDTVGQIAAFDAATRGGKDLT